MNRKRKNLRGMRIQRRKISRTEQCNALHGRMGPEIVPFTARTQPFWKSTMDESSTAPASQLMAMEITEIRATWLGGVRGFQSHI